MILIPDDRLILRIILKSGFANPGGVENESQLQPKHENRRVENTPYKPFYPQSLNFLNGQEFQKSPLLNRQPAGP